MSSAPVSYAAIAAKDSKDIVKDSVPAAAVAAISLEEKSSEDFQNDQPLPEADSSATPAPSSTLSKPASESTPTDATEDAAAADDSATAQSSPVDSKDAIPSIAKDKAAVLTPAPVPKVNVWKVRQTVAPKSNDDRSAALAPASEEDFIPAAASPVADGTTSPIPQSSQSPLVGAQSDSSFDPVSWPKPDEKDVAPTSAASFPTAAAASKAKAGKEKWVPLNIQPSASKPRGNKSARSANAKNAHNNNHNSTSSTSSPASNNTNGSNSAPSNSNNTSSPTSNTSNASTTSSAASSASSPLASTGSANGSAPQGFSKGRSTKVFNKGTPGSKRPADAKIPGSKAQSPASLPSPSLQQGNAQTRSASASSSVNSDGSSIAESVTSVSDAASDASKGSKPIASAPASVPATPLSKPAGGPKKGRSPFNNYNAEEGSGFVPSGASHHHAPNGFHGHNHHHHSHSHSHSYANGSSNHHSGHNGHSHRSNSGNAAGANGSLNGGAHAANGKYSGSQYNGGSYNPNSGNRRTHAGHYMPKYYVPNEYAYSQGYPGNMIPPYEAAIQMVVAQVEYYLSVENLCKDIYLRRHMNSQGWLPLSVLAEFNRVKYMAHGDYNLIVDACRSLTSSEFNGSKVRPKVWDNFVMPVESRSPEGKDEESNPPLPPIVRAPLPVMEAPRLVFNAAHATPFVPKSESADAASPASDNSASSAVAAAESSS